MQEFNFRKVPLLLYTPFLIMKKKKTLPFPVQPENTWDLGQHLMVLLSSCANQIKSKTVFEPTTHSHALLHHISSCSRPGDPSRLIYQEKAGRLSKPRRFSTFELASRTSIVAVGPISEVRTAGLTCPLFFSGWLDHAVLLLPAQCRTGN